MARRLSLTGRGAAFNQISKKKKEEEKKKEKKFKK
jgi:hypothetical protein